MESRFSAGLFTTSAWAFLQVRGGLYKLGFEEEMLMSDDVTAESWVGRQIQATGIGARGRVLNEEGWCAVHGEAMLWASQSL